MEPTSSGYRPATHRSIDMGAQRIPRRVLQTGLSFVKSNASHHGLMQNWWTMNAEYTYSFFSDARALQFVEQHGTHNERAAYRAVRTGAQKADLFRLLALKYVGGVYADVDTELRVPLRSIIPANSSAVMGRFWGSEFMAWERGHPLLVRAVRTVTSNVLRQVRLIQQGNSSAHCGSPHSCVIVVSGPFALREAFKTAARALGCPLQGLLPRVERTTPAVCPEAVRQVHVCAKDEGNVYRTWACGAAYHWDCRNSGAKRRCSTNHYSRYRGRSAARAFFNISVVARGRDHSTISPGVRNY